MVYTRQSHRRKKYVEFLLANQLYDDLDRFFQSLSLKYPSLLVMASSTPYSVLTVTIAVVDESAAVAKLATYGSTGKLSIAMFLGISSILKSR